MKDQKINDAMPWVVDDVTLRNYLDSCNEAFTNDSKFSFFKKDPRYTNILEHSSYEESLIYVSMLEKDKKKVIDKIDLLKENDIYGSPDLRDYDLWGNKHTLSPSTIRYIKNSVDIINYFGKDIKTIAEIGGGYGGLCKTMSCFYDFSKYYIFDLPEVNNLSSKYLSMFNFADRTISGILDNANLDKIDLTISNYAFSELSRDIQKKYLDNVIKKAKYFYIIDNHFSTGLYQTPGFTYEELASELSDYDIVVKDEISYGNKIYYGKIKSKK